MTHAPRQRLATSHAPSFRTKGSRSTTPHATSMTGTTTLAGTSPMSRAGVMRWCNATTASGGDVRDARAKNASSRSRSFARSSDSAALSGAAALNAASAATAVPPNAAAALTPLGPEEDGAPPPRTSSSSLAAPRGRRRRLRSSRLDLRPRALMARLKSLTRASRRFLAAAAKSSATLPESPDSRAARSVWTSSHSNNSRKWFPWSSIWSGWRCGNRESHDKMWSGAFLRSKRGLPNSAMHLRHHRCVGRRGGAALAEATPPPAKTGAVL
mmetsp:Transcript_14878/g.59657  ORF Transcript_14878/g.59657 Transcript_14878/m.59657 type:complete len:270 (-) Transcript_14878:1076-1885(-)